MTYYNPSQGYASSSQGHGGYYPTQYSASYAQPVTVAPSHASYAPQVVAGHPAYYGSDNGHHHHHSHSHSHDGQYYAVPFGERMRRFFGLAPRGPFKYKHNKTTWGFMGYSRRQRYMDPRTGAEVDRKGRPVYRV